jgi:hypothetical protein
MSAILISCRTFIRQEMFGILAQGRPPSWTRHSLFTLFPRVTKICIYRGGAESAVGLRNNMTMFRLTITPYVL